MESNTPLVYPYSELARYPDLATLTERCTLLTEILLDSSSLPQIQPVCRCLGAYLARVKETLEGAMRDYQPVAFDEESVQYLPEGWRLKETEGQCDYCRALNHVLLVSHFDRDMLPYLTRLLHDMTLSMRDGLALREHCLVFKVTH
ncbi:hypothetical protein JK158_10690 [Enterobacter sp. JGM127]|nr:hypothetical protein [Enterobacter sp. JGM127]